MDATPAPTPRPTTALTQTELAVLYTAQCDCGLTTCLLAHGAPQGEAHELLRRSPFASVPTDSRPGPAPGDWFTTAAAAAASAAGGAPARHVLRYLAVRCVCTNCVPAACPFAHGVAEMIYHPLHYKRTMCKRPVCAVRFCPDAHSLAEIADAMRLAEACDYSIARMLAEASDASYKREVCRNWAADKCERGATCPYAHGPDDLRGDYKNCSSNYKRSLCRNWTRYGTCVHGAKCTYAHGVEDMRRSERPAATSSGAPPPAARPVCKMWKRYQTCPHGPACTFAHC